MMWRDFKDEEDLICVNFSELIHDKPYFIDKEEAIHILETNDIERIIEDAENVYEVKTSNDILYFICPINARQEVKKWWKELKQILQSKKQLLN